MGRSVRFNHPDCQIDDAKFGHHLREKYNIFQIDLCSFPESVGPKLTQSHGTPRPIQPPGLPNRRRQIRSPPARKIYHLSDRSLLVSGICVSKANTIAWDAQSDSTTEASKSTTPNSDTTCEKNTRSFGSIFARFRNLYDQS